ncbi:MAG TPA: SDR family NAD(P)-dependent oxidoreductase [Polyangiaceae bacterium]|jgi:NAD(P)-dependent dehydrogenase (short-subunit alcohol dehydrogenase family)
MAWVAGVGSGSGLGAAVARKFASEGMRAVVTGRTPERLEALVREIHGAGGQALAMPGDVGRESDMMAIANRIAEEGTLEAAVYNASNTVWAPSLEITVAQFEETFRITLLGGFIFAREAIRCFLPRKAGTLIFTGATASLRGRPPFAAFAAAKAGLRSLSQSFAREFGPQGIHVAHAVIDGGIDGERVRAANPKRFAERGGDGLLAPRDIAEAYWHLYQQPRSAWTQELDLRPYNETF